MCGLLGIDVPVVQAPVGSATTPELVAAVSGAGGLGMLSLTWTGPDKALRRIRRIRELTDRPFAVNFVLEFPIEDRLELCLAEGVPVISTFWGDPARVTDRIHAAGALHLHTVGSAAQARQVVDAGVDVVVAQGWEAGGHVRGEVGALVLVPAVVDAVAPVPVIAAGGIADGRGLAAVLALGAQAGWMGTRFLLATEANVHDLYRDRIAAAAETDTVHTLLFDRGWPNAPHRVLRNSTVEAWEQAGRPAAPDRPGEGTVVATGPDAVTHLRYDVALAVAGLTGDVGALPLWAGQSAGLVHDRAAAAHIVADVVAGARAALAGPGT